ncbi:glycosyltransferase family 2 protein [Pseudobutyrivibrio xylanivorans]|uniref:Glycosyltransferase involved in cell wall bisynthesis n=1 Tax=Pseudobutyrivibrio xylanivorans TaxID=185007 RepID=A0A1G5S4D3_PSEXY|nr:glycosyltransferase family 2 protein [Pseudobutyrivibrio xylanivorans]SCZ81224.1 Glycosyltransferase involved in cell wall bisynthesis [Pseudobutyrivibrio xylanivorans]
MSEKNRISFSIIIPVFNTEKYLKKCMDSVVNQDYEAYEIIVVDDGSTDNSASILDEYSLAHDNVHVIHKTNGGIGTAILKGISAARNEYIIFVDSDDYIDRDLCKILADCAMHNNLPDMIQYGLIFSDEAGNSIRVEEYNNYSISGNGIVVDHFENCPSPSLACRTFKRKLYEDVEYLNQNIGIDEILIAQLISKCETMVSIEDCLYYVLERTGSVSRQKFTDETINQYNKVYELLLRKFNDISPIINYIRIKYIELLRKIYFECLGQNQKIRWCTYDFKYHYKLLKGCDEYKKKGKRYALGVILFLHFPQLYTKIRRIISI